MYTTKTVYFIFLVEKHANIVQQRCIIASKTNAYFINH